MAALDLIRGFESNSVADQLTASCNYTRFLHRAHLLGQGRGRCRRFDGV